MVSAWKKLMGVLALVSLVVLGSMTALAEEAEQNPTSPHVWYQVFADGEWKNEVQDSYPADSSSRSGAEGMKVWLTGVEGSVSYRVCLQNGGWQEWVSDAAVAGGENTGNPIEAIQIKLGGYVGQVLDIWYRATVGNGEKLGWARSGELAGTVGEGTRLVSLEAYLTVLNQNVGEGGALRTTLPHGFYNDESGAIRYNELPGIPYTGWVDFNGNRYYVKDSSMVTGWQYIDGLKFYFNEDGILIQDLDPVIGIQSSYVLKINKQLNCLTVYAKDGDNGYIIPVKSMLCSVGDDTPIGTFHTPEKYRWRLMVNDTYTQYATRITAGKGFLIHSICYDKPDIYTMQSIGYNGLGVVRSLGCVRLTAVNAKWVYDNCALGTTIEIFEDPSSPGPFFKPSVTSIPVDQAWDPTDPLVSEEVKAEAEAKQQAEEEQQAAEAAAAVAQAQNEQPMSEGDGGQAGNSQPGSEQPDNGQSSGTAGGQQTGEIGPGIGL